LKQILKTYLKINLSKTTIKQTQNKFVIIKHQGIKELRVTSTSPINFIKVSSSKVKVTKRIGMSVHTRWGVGGGMGNRSP